ncbi:hypothetical protein Tco_0810640 [Tanacetum coccineum]
MDSNFTNENDPWEYSLDIDDSDLHLTPVLRSSSSAHVEPSPYTPNPVTIIPGPAGVVQLSNSICVEPSSSTPNPVRIIPGPAGLVQRAKLLKENVFILDPDGALMSTQEYMQKVVEDVGEDADFNSGAWVSATNYVNAFGGTVTGCLGDIDNFLKKGKLEQVVAIVKSCSPNALGDLNVTLKDLSGTVPGTIHYKVLDVGSYEKDITVGAAMILANVSVFTPKPSKHYLNITKRNVVEVFHGSLNRYKARLVANGSTQIVVYQLDVKNAFFRDPRHPDYVCLLQRSLMGLNRPLGPGFSDLQPMLLGLVFSIVDKYAIEVLERAGMLTCNLCRTPVDTDSKLAAAILHYIPGLGSTLYSSTTSSLVAYSDADWAGCPTTRRSTSGYCVFLGNNLLSWSSKRQFTLSRSSAEAEYRGVANAVAETCWLRNLLRELHTPLSTATIVYCDNVSAVYLSSNPVQHQRTKHIEIDIHFVRDLVTTGHIRVLHVPSRYQYADIFTKGLPTALFDEFRDSLSVRSSLAQTARGC